MSLIAAFITLVVVQVAIDLMFPPKPTKLTHKEVMALNCLRQAIGDPPFHTVDAANEFVNAFDTRRKLKVLRAIQIQLTK